MVWLLISLSALAADWCESNEPEVQHTIKQLTELYRVQDCTKLKKFAEKEKSLSLASKQIKDPRPLQMFAKLHHLNLVSNNITDATFLNGFEELKWVDLSSNPLKDSPLVELPTVEILHCRQCKLSQVPFTELRSIREVSLRNNQIDNIDFVSQSPKLRVLIVENNYISETLSLYNHRSLKRVDLFRNPILREGCPTEKPAIRALREACKRVFPEKP